MDGNRLLTLLESPMRTTGADRADLAVWCGRFPWAAAISVLLARASREAGHGDSERDLLRACAHAPNRQTVFTALTTELRDEVAGVAGSRDEDSGMSEQVAGVAGSRDEVAGVAGSRDEVAGVAGSGEQVAGVAGSRDEVAGVAGSRNEDSGMRDEDAGVAGSREQVAGVSGSRDEGKITRGIVSDNVTIRVDSPNFTSTSTSTPPLSLEDTILAEAVARSIELDVMAYEPEVEEEVERAPRSFGAWLAARAGQTGWAGAGGVEGVDEDGGAREGKEGAILERFIRENPRIGRVREEVDPRVEGLARASLEEGEGMEALVTETMAQLYARQGQRAKAKRAYELLALKYPEKSAYFAAALKNLG